MTTYTNKNRKHNSLSVGINFFLTDHCNLNCKGCMAYAPLANKKFLSIDKFTNDLTRINLLSNNNIHAIHLLGGEPLLHPDCDKFIIISRKIFNRSIIRLFTNAILLQYMDKQFWMMLHDNCDYR